MIGLRSVFAEFVNLAPAYVSTRGSSPWTSRPGSVAQMEGIEPQLRTMSSTGIVHAIVSQLTQGVAEADWRLMRGESEVTTHPAARLWARPNAFMDQDEFTSMAMQHYELAGETDWLLARAGVMPGFEGAWELWPLRPDWLKPIPHPTRYLEGWIYTVPGEQPVPYKVDEIIQMKRQNPMDPYRGLSWVASAMADIAGERAARDWQNTFFRNDATPGGVIEFPERQTDELFAEFVDRWRQTHQGPMNAHRLAVLDDGAKFVPTPVSMRDMQFEELRKLQREFIRQASGFPRPLLGDTENVNKAAALAGEYMYVRWHVRPRLNLLQATLNTKLLPKFARSRSLEFQFDTPVPADKELEILELDSIATRAKTLVEAGYNPDDVAEYVGLPKMAYTEPAAPEPPPSGGGSRTAGDPEARATWEKALKLKSDSPYLTWEAVADFVGVSDRTLRRYREAFEA